jgi:SAM-dependent methyltransferase
MCDTAAAPLVLAEADIRRHGPGNILAVCWRQWRAERDLARRGIHLRSTDPDQVAAAYQAMTAAEFDAVNGRQNWANWRTIPRCLSRHVPDRPLRILDLGCGSGSSTLVLAFWAPAGSHVLACEKIPALVAIARRRACTGRSGEPVRVEFSCQSVSETFREAEGSPVPDRAIDVVNASGIVGHHLNEVSVQPLLAEIGRVLTEEGIAMLDVGPTLGHKALTDLMDAAGYLKLGHWRSCWIDPTGQVVYRRSG